MVKRGGALAWGLPNGGRPWRALVIEVKAEAVFCQVSLALVEDVGNTQKVGDLAWSCGIEFVSCQCLPRRKNG